MADITIKASSGDVIHRIYDRELLLSEILKDNGIEQHKPCGGKGLCGKCRVIASGELSPVSETERSLLSSAELENGTRLSCLAYAAGDVVIDYIKAGDVQGVAGGGGTDIAIDPITVSRDCYGAAIDIGTTTIAGYLYRFPGGSCVKKLCVPNKQAQFGADVISRLGYAADGGLKELQTAVTGQIADMEKQFGEKIDTFVITGNTAMLHLYTGMETAGLCVMPFKPESLFGHWVGRVYLPRCMSAFVGADITTSVLACGMPKNETSFLVDIGTNGEMVLCHNNRYTCCSTAAGPAFEGAGISMGTMAVPGAIDRVYIADGALGYTTIGGAEPIGICGSGLVDAVACLLALGIVDETGYMKKDCEIGGSGVRLTAQDIRQVQLAKSAVRSGIDTLLHECRIVFEDIDTFYIAGGFGSYINKDSAIKIGLIPEAAAEKIKVIGNGAGIGAGMILKNKQALREAERIAAAATAAELSDSPFFMERFMDNMTF